MSQVLLNDQQRMLLTLNKRTLLEEADSSEPMTDTPPNSSGETTTEKLEKDFRYTGLLHKVASRLDTDEVNRRAIMSVTKRRFADIDVSVQSWAHNYDDIVDSINRKVYESQHSTAVLPQS